ncbi:MAG: NrsF family protein [Rhodospirillales bacterium]|nr:NrsF family protein [Rhodospirillales bacterium]
MTGTEALIAQLAAGAGPVHRLRPVWQRVALWLALVAMLFAVLLGLHGPRGDLGASLADPRFLMSLGGALATGVLGAFAALLAAQPDRGHGWLLLPLPAAALWLGTIGYGCLTDWVRIAPGGMQLGETARCFATLLLLGVPGSGAMLWLLRRAAPLRLEPALGEGALAVAALTASGLMLLHAIAASALVLLWNFGAVLLLISADVVAGRRLLRRSAPPCGAAPRPTR